MEEIAWVLREYGPDRQEFRATIPCNTKSSICPFRKKKGSFPMKTDFDVQFLWGFFGKNPSF